MSNIRTENWCGYNIRFVEIDGEWWAILKDICDALNLRTNDVAQRLDPVEMLQKVRVTEADPVLNGVTFSSRPNGVRKTHDMLAINEIGIYEALFASRRLEARKFRRWSATVMQKLRRNVGLEQYEIMRMTDQDIQDEIDDILDTLFYDEKTGKLMQSVTVQGGDVIQVPFED